MKINNLKYFSISLKVSIFLCLLALCNLGSYLALANEITIMTPKPGSVVLSRQSETNLVVRISDPKNVIGMKITTGGETFAPFGIWRKQDQSYAHFILPLKKGSNSFILEPMDMPIRIKYRPLRSMLTLKTGPPGVFLFHKQDSLQAECNICHEGQIPEEIPDKINEGPLAGCESYSPECYSCHKKLFSEPPHKHDPTARLLCKSCHIPEEEGPGSISFPKGRMDQLCLRCHRKGKSWLAKKHIHGPVGTGDCTVCHDPHGDQYPFQLWAEPSISLCVSCHTDKRKLSIERSDDYYPHGILKGRGCLACHDPHASDHRFQLFKPINDLCTDCHINIDSKNRVHPVKGHPVQGKKDPRRPNRDLVCTSCHNPHGSNFRFLLIGDVLGGHVCSKCHHDGRKKPGNTQ